MYNPFPDENREALFCVDAHFRLLDVDPQAEVLCHQSRAQLLGLTIGDAFPSLADSLFFLNAQEALQHHKVLTYTAFSLSLNCSVVARLSPLSDSEKAVFVQTVPSHKQVWEEQGAGNALVQSVLACLQMTIAVLDADVIITAVNDTWKPMAAGACSLDQLKRTGIGMN